MIKNKDFIVLACIRGGSKGYPNKNLEILNGEVLYERTVKQGLRICENVILSTDIKRHLLKYYTKKFTLSERPSHLASDDATITSVIIHEIRKNNLFEKNIILLQVTSPLRSDNDILDAVALFNTNKYNLVISIVEKDNKSLKFGTLEGQCFKSINRPEYCFSNRQSLPKLFAPNGAVYIFSARKFIDDGGFPTDNIGAIKMPIKRSVDIDNASDLKLAENFLRNHNLNEII